MSEEPKLDAPAFATPTPPSEVKLFNRRLLESQFSALTTLFSTNFIEVLRTRMIYDAKVCNTSHYSNKATPVPTSFMAYCFSKRNFYLKQACFNCLPSTKPLEVMSYIAKHDGFKHLFLSGISQNIYSHIVRTGLFFPIFDFFKDKLQPHVQRELYRSILSSTVARTITSIFSFPIEVTRIERQSKKTQSSVLNSLRSIRSQPRRFFNIYMNFWSKEMIFSIIFWSVYELLREKFDREPHHLWNKSACALLAGCCSALCSFPADFV